MSIASVINKAEIQLYSTLISVMSGINQLKAGEAQIAKTIIPEMPVVSMTAVLDEPAAAGETTATKWDALEQTLLSILLWTLLGFAAGFLIGMIGAR